MKYCQSTPFLKTSRWESRVLGLYIARTAVYRILSTKEMGDHRNNTCICGKVLLNMSLTITGGVCPGHMYAVKYLIFSF